MKIDQTISDQASFISNSIFIFQKMKDVYNEHWVASSDFTPIVSEQGISSDEWVAKSKIKPLFVKEGRKEDILSQTSARVFTIVPERLQDFRGFLRTPASAKIWNPKLSLSVVLDLKKKGVLKEENACLSGRSKSSEIGTGKDRGVYRW